MCNHQDYPRSQRYQEACDQIPQTSRSNYDRWLTAAMQIIGEEGVGGKDVIQNMFLEQNLDLEIFVEFLTSIANSYAEEQAVTEAYLRAKRAIFEKRHLLFCRGSEARLNNGILLHHVLSLKKLQSITVDDASKLPPEKLQERWDDILELQREDPEGYSEILTKIVPCKHDTINWVYFDQSQQDIDPLANRPCRECLDELGLSKEWYPRGQYRTDPKGAWRIHYRIHTQETTRHIPSFADTIPGGWNPYFQLTNDEEWGWGWTRPIGQPRGTLGMPEVVHKGWKPSERRGVVEKLEFIELSNNAL